MKYKNTKTGVTFSSPCVVSGGDWILLKDDPKFDEETKTLNEEEIENTVDDAETSAAAPEQQADEKDELVAGLEGITKKQIMQELDAFGIKYNPSSKKQELYDLMMQGK
ncbi:hypothetical protein [Enterococcus casseliflavus]|uniref:hypothetical protein n=1 Tax=Enterococcus TaxID=1350 RepID=UPI002DB64EFC|nr:hypothetical protein [Enterococcus casseliflavus]MEB8399703.1 hypothetical protein [Enterococcus casseliflavus]